MEEARSHIARTGSTTGIFRPDSLAQAPGKAKHFFSRFTVRFMHDHQFVNSTGVLETLTPRDYQGQFQWHDGQGRLTIDAPSYPLTADGSNHPHFTADFAYYSLPVLLGSVIQAWVTARAAVSPFRLALSPQQEPRHELATAEFLRIPDGGLPHTGHWALGSSSRAPAAAPSNFHGQPVHAPHFLAAGNSEAHPPSRLLLLGPAPFSTPPMPKKVLFVDSPQSETQRTN